MIGRSTVPAMQSGIYWGYVGLIEGLITRIKAEFGGPMKVSPPAAWRRCSPRARLLIEHIEPDLTLDGLRMLAERNPAPDHAPGAYAADRDGVAASHGPSAIMCQQVIDQRIVAFRRLRPLEMPARPAAGSPSPGGRVEIG